MTVCQQAHTTDPSKTKMKLVGKTKFKDLVRLMADTEIETAKKEAHMNGYNDSDIIIRRSRAG